MQPLAAAALFAVWLVSVPAANAQSPSPSPVPSDQSQTISDEKLDAAAAALKQVSSVKENYQQRIESAAPSDKQRLADEANNALEQAVTGQGLSVEEYTSIIVVAQNNPEVREKILQRIRPPANR
jgi:predicted ATPase with chaperone activity